MIKELGSIGFFIKFNSDTASGKIFDIYSSASANEVLYTSSVIYSTSTGLNSVKSVVYNSTASGYLNGSIKVFTPSFGPSISLNEWVHLSYSFYPKLQITSSADFLIRLGNTINSDFNIQNLYISDVQLKSSDIREIYNEFTTASSVETGNTNSKSITIYDKDESLHTASNLGIVFQPNELQLRYIGEVFAVAEIEAGNTFSATDKTRDGVIIPNRTGNDRVKVLCLSDNKIYKINQNFTTEEVSTSIGDYVYVTNGFKYDNSVFRKNNSNVFIRDRFLEKIVYIRQQ